MKASVSAFRSLADSLTRQMIAVSLLCTLVVAGLQMSWVYRQERLAFEAQIRLVTQTHMPLLSAALWDIEPRQVQSLLDSIAAVPQVHFVLLDAATGQHFQSGAVDVHADEAHTPDVIISVPSPGDPDRSLGQLSVDFNEDYLRFQLATAALQVALISGLLTLVLGLANNLMVRRHVLRPMRRIAEFAVALAPGKLTPQLRLDRAPRPHRDELDLVADGFLTLQTDIARYVQERVQHEAQLAAQAEGLDIKVKERTAQLQGVSRYLEVLSRNSSRFLNVSLEAFPELMRNSLREMVQHMEGCDLAVAEQLDPASPLLWRYVWQSPAHGLLPLNEGEELAEGLVGPLSPGWNHQRLQDLSQAAPQRVQALQRYGVQAMAWCAYQSDDSARYLIALSARPQPWSDLSDRLTQVAADMVFNALRRRRDQLTMEHMHRELHHLSHTDPLTGLANRRRFDGVKLEETRRALRNSLPLAVVSIDIDHFKSFNDSYGHARGDACLVTVAQLIQETFHRAGELPARLGGEEFTVLLPGQSLQAAASHAERLRQRVVDLGIPHVASPLGVVSISIGIGCLDAGTVPQTPPPELPPEQQIAAVLEAADHALYQAKRAGRNRVQMA